MLKGQSWKGVSAKYGFRCKKHGEYPQAFHSHNDGSGCSTCGRMRIEASHRLSIAEAEKRCPDMLKGQRWKGVRAKYGFRCKKHGKYQQRFDNHNGGRGCKICSGKLLTIAEAEKRCPDMLKGQRWKGVSATYRFRCKKHGKYPQEFNNHTRGNGCPTCAITKRAAKRCLTISEAYKRCPDMLKGQRWSGVMAKYLFLCKQHGEYRQVFHNHTRGDGCPTCSESRGEKEVARVLKSLKVLFTREHRIPECKNSQTLPFDFAVRAPKLMLIEFNGEQHYKAGFFGGVKAFKYIQHRDGIKKRFCKRERIPLLVIPYTKIDRVEELVRKFLQT